MQPEVEFRKIRHVRLPHSKSLEIQDDSGHLWAVSYADFLMVLLCFFILFFSTDENRRSSVVQRIGEITGALSGSGKGEAYSLPMEQSHFHAMIQSSLSNLPVSITKDGEKLTLLFPENFYENGSLFPTRPNHLKVLNETLATLKPYISSIEITFIGHTDSTPVSQSHGRYLSDNFDLSSLRATRVVQYAVHAGFPADHLAAQGSAFHVRRSRTLSIVIRPSLQSKEGITK